MGSTKLLAAGADPDATVAAPTSEDIAFHPASNNSCGVQTARRFVSAEEIAHLLALVNETGGWEASATGGKMFQQPTGQRTGAFAWKVNRDPVVLRIEERIAAATGIALHPAEDMISFAKIRPRGSIVRGRATVGHFAPFGLHHETDTRPNRARTVLVYIHAPREKRDSSRKGGHASSPGGRTIFPLCGPLVSPQSRQGKLITTFGDALQSQWGDGAATGYGRHAGFDPAMEHPFNDLLTEVCRGESGFSVTPAEGSAIMFDSVEPGTSVPERRTWHAGCNVISGTKIILQKFKELPSADRNPATANFMPENYRPYRPGG